MALLHTVLKGKSEHDFSYPRIGDRSLEAVGCGTHRRLRKSRVGRGRAARHSAETKCFAWESDAGRSAMTEEQAR